MELNEILHNISAEIRVIVTFLEDLQVSEIKNQDSIEQAKELPIIYHDLDSLAGTWTEEDASVDGLIVGSHLSNFVF